MIKKYFVLVLFFFLTIGHAQSPEKFTYQSIIKTSTGYLLKNQDVGLRISILRNSSNGIEVYSEEHFPTSNSNGLVTLIIGEGLTGDNFSDINWGGGEYFLKVEVDPEGGVNYTMNQTSQLLSVPYALYAENAKLNLLGQDFITLQDQTLTINKVDLADDVEGILPVANGGTGSSSSPMVGVITAADEVTARSVLGLGTAAITDSSDYATAAQGLLADSAQQPPIEGAFVDGDKTKLDGIEALADVTDTANVTAAGALMESEITNLAQVKAFDSSVFATAAQGLLADSAQQPPIEGAFVDGDKTKLDGIEALADVTDTANVTAAGALMESEITNLAQVKAFDSSVFATAAQGLLADSSLQDASVFATAAQGALADSSLQDASAFATAAQGALADTALQDASAFATAAQGALADSSLQDASAFATAAQGLLADSSLQDASVFATAAQGALADSSLQDASAFATAAQGLLADSSLQDASVFATAAQGDKADTALQAANDLSDLNSAATARTNLGVDITGTDNSTDVSLAGSLDYLSLTDQTITLGQVDASTDIFGLSSVAISGDFSDLTNVPSTAGAAIYNNAGSPTLDTGITALEVNSLLGLGTAATTDTNAYATAGQGILADSAQQPPSEGAFADGDKTKLDNIEALADITDTANVTDAGALMDSEVTNLAEVKAFDSTDYATAGQGILADSAQQPPSEGAFADGDKTKLDNIEALADITDTANVTDAGALMDSEVTNLAEVKAFDSTDYATAGQGILADSAQQPPSEGAFADGDKTKLDNIEALADITDTANVTDAGALMDSEVTNLAEVKAFDSTDYATAGQGILADSAQQPPSEGAFADGDKTKLDNIEALADITDTANVTDAGALMDSEVTNLAEVKAFDSTDYATAGQGILADSAQQPPSEGAFADGDKTKLDNIEALADITDTANVTDAGALMDSEVTNLAEVKAFDSTDYATAGQGILADSAQQPPSEGAFADGDKTKLDNIEALADITDTANVTDAGALMDSEVTNLAEVKAFDSTDYATAGQGILADSAQQPPSEGAFADGDKTKLDNIEALADITDTANVTDAGALMDSEVTNLAEVKAFDSTDYATAGQGILADSAQQPPSEGAFADGDKTKLDNIEALADITDTANVTDAGALMDSEVTNLAEVKAFDSTDYATAGQGILADSAQQPPSEGAFADGDKTKLDNIEALADITDTANVTDAGALMDSEVTNLAEVKAFDSTDYATAGQGILADSAQQPPSEGAFADGDKTKLDNIEALADITDTANVTDAGALMDSEVTNLAEVKAFDSTDYATAGQGILADSAQQPPSEGAFADGDKTKLDNIEALADITDTANVTDAGALMDSEVTNLAEVKAFDSTDYATAGQGILADSAQQPPSEGAFADGDKTKLDNIEALADITDTANVTDAGALMDSEVTNLAEVKAFDSTDYATAGQGILADSALQTSNNLSDLDSPNSALNSLGLYFGTASFSGTTDVIINAVSGLKNTSKIFVTHTSNFNSDIYVNNIDIVNSQFTLSVSGGFSSTVTVNWLVIIN